MVLFKFSLVYVNHVLSVAFTFHYGPIQMTKKKTLFHAHIYLHSTMVLFKFTLDIYSHFTEKNLHSTMVLFKSSNYNTTFENVINLHSTMVLFKYEDLDRFDEIANIFTFHYGPIQITPIVA